MKEDSKRAIRRKHYARLKKKRSNHWGWGRQGWRSWEGIEIMPPEIQGMAASTPCNCSCWMCGNPRHHAWHGKECLTMQERKADERFKYEIEEYESSDSHDRAGNADLQEECS